MALISVFILAIILFNQGISTIQCTTSRHAFFHQNDSTFGATLLDSIQKHEFNKATEGLSQQEKDSLQNIIQATAYNPIQNTFWDGAQVNSTPDGLYRVVVYSGRQCGANCFPIFKSEIFTTKYERIAKDERVYLYPIQAIYKLKETTNRYLILQTSYARLRLTGLIGKQASIIQIDPTGTKQICIFNNSQCNFGAMQPGYITVKPTMDLDTSSGILHFRYYKTDVDEISASPQDTIIAEKILFTGDTMKILERQFTPVSDLRYYNR